MHPVLAIDIGGTKIAASIIDEAGTVIADQQVPTVTSPDADVVWAPLADMVATLLASHHGPIDIGISSAGPIDAPAGTISPVNIAAWREFPIRDRVLAAARAALPSIDPEEIRGVLAGDGHCMALGEHWLGAGRDWSSMVGLVISTGVGGGIVIDDQLFTGSTGNALHIGHTSVNAWGPQCACGSHGCVELYARGPALVHAAQARGWQGADGRALTKSAGDGDPIARDVIDHGMRAAAAGIATIATHFEVTNFVIGGGLAKAGHVIFEPLRRHLHDFATLAYVRDLELRPAALANAGLIGAASLALSLSGRGGLRHPIF